MCCALSHGSRTDKNQFYIDPKMMRGPALPRFSTRDHLHDRHRELCVFDPGNPGLQTFVRVTRRRHPDPRVEAQMAAVRQDRMLQQQVIEELQAEPSTPASSARGVAILRRSAP